MGLCTGFEQWNALCFQRSSFGAKFLIYDETLTVAKAAAEGILVASEGVWMRRKVKGRRPEDVRFVL